MLTKWLQSVHSSLKARFSSSVAFTTQNAASITDNRDDLTNDSNIELITAEPLRRAIGERYLTYALSTIMDRALPDARDGLKPVHRRILFAMRELRLGATGGFRKSAKISGDVMGNYKH